MDHDRIVMSYVFMLGLFGVSIPYKRYPNNEILLVNSLHNIQLQYCHFGLNVCNGIAVIAGYIAKQFATISG